MFNRSSYFVSYLGHTVKRLSRCPYPATDDVLPVTTEEWELHRRTTLFKQLAIVSAQQVALEMSCKELTFLTHRTTMVPVLVHSSSVSCWRSMSSQLFLIRNSSSQKKSLTTSGDASSKIVLLRYCGGPFCNEANHKKHTNSQFHHLPYN